MASRPSASSRGQLVPSRSQSSGFFAQLLDTLGLPPRLQLQLSLGTRQGTDASGPAPVGRSSSSGGHAEQALGSPRAAEPDPEAAESSAAEAATVSEGAAAHRLASGFSAFEQELAGWILSHASFVALLIAFTLFQHSAALGWFVASSVALVRSNRVVRSQAGRKASPQLLRLHLTTFVLVLTAGGSLFLARERSVSLQLLSRDLVLPTVGQCFFEALLVDVLARVVTTWAKVLVVCLHPCGSPAQFRKRAALLTLLEYGSLLLRCLLPSPVWYAFYTGQPAKVMRWLSSGVYLGMKLRVSTDRAKLVYAAWGNLRAAGTAYGQPASAEEVMESGSACSICQEAMVAPLRLNCRGESGRGHIFCEACIEEWLQRPEGNTCPMCRAVVRPAGMMTYSDGTTSVLPHVF